MITKLFTIVAIALMLCACAGEPTATPTPVPTATPVPTYTPYPTYTPIPTATATPTDTLTPTPEATHTPTETPKPTATPKPKVGTRTNPVPLGESVILVRGDRKYRGHIKEVIWDQARVKQMLLDANMFNRIPAEGYEGVLIYFVCEYLSGPEDKPYGMSYMDFDYLCGNGKFFKAPSAVVPYPEFGGSGFPGSIFEGWIYRTGAVSDKPDLLVWKKTWLSSLGEGIYLALQK